MSRMKTWFVIIKSDGGHTGYLIHALNEDIARDACMRAHKDEHPNSAAEVVTAYETELYTPVKVLSD